MNGVGHVVRFSGYLATRMPSNPYCTTTTLSIDTLVTSNTGNTYSINRSFSNHYTAASSAHTPHLGNHNRIDHYPSKQNTSTLLFSNQFTITSTLVIGILVTSILVVSTLATSTQLISTIATIILVVITPYINHYSSNECSSNQYSIIQYSGSHYPSNKYYRNQYSIKQCRRNQCHSHQHPSNKYPRSHCFISQYQYPSNTP